MELPDIVYNIQELGKLRSKLDSLFEEKSDVCPHCISSEDLLYEGEVTKTCNRSDNLSVGTHHVTFCSPEFCPMGEIDNDVESLSAYPKQ